MTTPTWQPSANLQNLHLRADVIKTIRDFFYQRNVLEVETPQLCHTSVTDPFIQSMPVSFQAHSGAVETYFLQTSPEYAMKRLLALGSGDIFQIAKAFRQGDVGRFHNPEFTLLEWYRVGFDDHALMDEVDALLQLVLTTPPAKRNTYGELFASRLQLNPHTATINELIAVLQKEAIQFPAAIEDRNTLLDLLMMHCIEPTLAQDRPHFIYDYPLSQAALARIKPSIPPVAARFEVYYQGIELANGFYELQDAKEQRDRFVKNQQERKALDMPSMLIDEHFIAALAFGLPDCAGVALGIDRLIMLKLGAKHISDVISFDFARV